MPNVEEYRNLKKQLLNTEYHFSELFYHELIAIDDKYNVRIASLQQEIYRQQYDILELEHYITYVQQAKKNNEEVDWNRIKLRTDNELYDFKQRFLSNEEYSGTINHTLNNRELKELRNLYTTMLERVHPTISDSHVEQKEKMYTEAVNAFINYDLNLMISLVYLTNYVKDDLDWDDYLLVNKRYNEMANALKEREEQIAMILDSNIYRQGKSAVNDSVVDNKINHLNELSASLQLQKNYLTNMLKNLL